MSERVKCTVALRTNPSKAMRMIVSADMAWQEVLDLAASKFGLPAGSISEVSPPLSLAPAPDSRTQSQP